MNIFSIFSRNSIITKPRNILSTLMNFNCWRVGLRRITTCENNTSSVHSSNEITCKIYILHLNQVEKYQKYAHSSYQKRFKKMSFAMENDKKSIYPGLEPGTSRFLSVSRRRTLYPIEPANQHTLLLILF
jgi:hypothetical protein